MHVVQVSATFDRFPQMAFGSVRELNDEACEAVKDDVTKFWRFLEKQDDYRESITVFLLSGWGTPHSLSPKIDDSKAPSRWRCLALSFADAAVLGACENGTFHDISRILEQVERIESEGFSIQNVNGILNLFGFWRRTDGNLIPEHMQELEPPCYVMIPTDDLLNPRLEASKKRDVRALALSDGAFKVMQRIDWRDADDLNNVHISSFFSSERHTDRLVAALGVVEIRGPTETTVCGI